MLPILYILLLISSILAFLFFFLWQKKERNLQSEKSKSLELEKNLIAREEKINALNHQITTFEETKKDIVKISENSVLELAGKISNKLLDDHKRENEEAKKRNDEIIKNTTNDLHQKFNHMFERMKSLHDNVSSYNKTVDVIKSALLNPTGAGNLGEITLENIFKASSLVEGQDYKMQFHISPRNSNEPAGKPDAIIFLPNNNVMVVDSKSSKNFLEISYHEENENIEAKENSVSSLKRTVNEHLNQLIKRNYQKLIEDNLKHGGNKTNLCFTLMFLPTELALEKIRDIDPEFMDKAFKHNIIPVGPTGLVNILIQSQYLIFADKQNSNIKIIAEEVREMLNNIFTLSTHGSNLGKSLKSSMSHFDKFAASFNSNFLRKVERLKELGVETNKNKQIEKIERYDFTEKKNSLEIESENYKLSQQ